MPQIIYRSHEPADKNPAARLVLEVFLEEGVNELLTANDYITRSPVEHWAVALYQGKVVGAQFYAMDGRKGHLIDIAVEHAYREQGIGTALTNLALECMKQNNAAEVFVNVENERWSRTLGKLDFENITRSLASGGKTSIRMKKLL